MKLNRAGPIDHRSSEAESGPQLAARDCSLPVGHRFCARDCESLAVTSGGHTAAGMTLTRTTPRSVGGTPQLVPGRQILRHTRHLPGPGPCHRRRYGRQLTSASRRSRGSSTAETGVRTPPQPTLPWTWPPAYGASDRLSSSRACGGRGSMAMAPLLALRAKTAAWPRNSARVFRQRRKAVRRGGKSACSAAAGRPVPPDEPARGLTDCGSGSGPGESQRARIGDLAPRSERLSQKSLNVGLFERVSPRPGPADDRNPQRRPGLRMAGSGIWRGGASMSLVKWVGSGGELGAVPDVDEEAGRRPDAVAGHRRQDGGKRV